MIRVKALLISILRKNFILKILFLRYIVNIPLPKFFILFNFTYTTCLIYSLSIINVSENQIKHIILRLFTKNIVMWNFESCFRLDSLISGLLNTSDSLSENLLRTQLTEIMLERNFVGVLLTLINIKTCEWKFLSSQLIKCNAPKFQPIFRQISCYKIVFITVSVCN